MEQPTRAQAIREAVFELGAGATPAMIAEYVRRHYGFVFNDLKYLSALIAMVNQKMDRKNKRTPDSMDTGNRG
jgi:hypothetical protein